MEWCQITGGKIRVFPRVNAAQTYLCPRNFNHNNLNMSNAYRPNFPSAGFSAILSIGLFLLLLLPFSACNEEKKQIDTLYKETEVIHDEAMKDLADMNRVARAIKESLRDSTITPDQSARYTDALSAMGKAEDDMMAWMKNFKSPDNLPGAEALQYLREQKALIEKNRSDIRAALEAGKKLQGE